MSLIFECCPSMEVVASMLSSYATSTQEGTLSLTFAVAWLQKTR
jgi:hypothetical protein